MDESLYIDQTVGVLMAMRDDLWREYESNDLAIVTTIELVIARRSGPSPPRPYAKPSDEVAFKDSIMPRHASGYMATSEVMNARNLQERLVAMARASGKTIIPVDAARFILDIGKSSASVTNLIQNIRGEIRMSDAFDHISANEYKLKEEWLVNNPDGDHNPEEPKEREPDEGELNEAELNDFPNDSAYQNIPEEQPDYSECEEDNPEIEDRRSVIQTTNGGAYK